MPKFKKKQDYKKQPSEPEADQKPKESVTAGPEEIVVPSDPENPVIMPKETAEKKICGIGGCTTWYDDPVIMERHRKRQHGVGVENINKPKQRHAEIKLT